MNTWEDDQDQIRYLQEWIQKHRRWMVKTWYFNGFYYKTRYFKYRWVAHLYVACMKPWCSWVEIEAVH